MVFSRSIQFSKCSHESKGYISRTLKANGEKNRNEISKKVKDILEKVGLGEEFENKYPNEVKWWTKAKNSYRMCYDIKT